MIVPEKTIACIPVIPDNGIKEFDMDFSSFLVPLNDNHKREWFTSHFYKCLPLSIGNMQGFAFKSPFEFDVVWNGGSSREDLRIILNKDIGISESQNHVSVSSEFGSGIFTINLPLILKTPPGVNLMTIAPPNYPVPGISPMTGVVEADNLRFTFTLNFKVDLVDTVIRISKGYPIMGILPVPRYFCDSFTLANAYDILDKDVIEEERQVFREHAIKRSYQRENSEGVDGTYYKGTDGRGNKFEDHQVPKKNNMNTDEGL